MRLKLFVLLVPLFLIGCDKSSPDIRVGTEVKLPPYPAELAQCKARARAKLEGCAEGAETAGALAQCQTAAHKRVAACLDASERIYREARKGRAQ